MSALKIVTTIALGVALAAVFTLLIMVLRGRRERRCHIYWCQEPGVKRVYVCTRHGQDPRLPNLEDIN